MILFPEGDMQLSGENDENPGPLAIIIQKIHHHNVYLKIPLF